MRKATRTLVTLGATGALALAPALAAPASAQQNGLVNVTVTDVANDNEILNENNVGVGVAAGIAANVCNVSVGVISRQLAQGNDFSCESDASGQTVDITQSS